ncbi:hypothetical protein ACFRAQ_13615 [Nocardia sp. NPDC056611]|uniref:hypothetical protein n=1 Tax=Nocardia sp. NPDC056611 TaxID=3345877 RepID=UPI003671B11B
MTHPDLSSTLFHFVDRARPTGNEVPDEIRAMGAAQRLESILTQNAISAFVTFSGGDPAVCMTEASWAGVQHLIEDRGQAPWALMFDRQAVYDAGGGPVWYARPHELERLKEVPGLRTWAVKFSADSDWSHEREWRIPRSVGAECGAPSIPLSELGLCGVIVGDPDWDCRILAHNPHLGDGSEATHWDFELVRSMDGIPRYWWNSCECRFERL